MRAKIHTKSKKMSKNVNTIIQPVIIISTLAAVCNISKKHENAYTFSFPAAIFTFAILILGLVHFFLIPYGILFIDRMSHKIEFDLFNISSKIDPTSEHFITKMVNPILVSLVGNSFRILILLKMHRKLPYILKLLENADNLLKTSNADMQRDGCYIKIFTSIAILLSLPFQIYSIFSISKSCIHFALFFVNLYNNFSAVCCELQFISICWIIYRKFKLIHKRLHHFGEILIKNSLFEEKGNRLVKFSISKQLEQITFTKVMDYQDLANKVISLKDAQHILCEACESLNAMYNLQLLISISSCVMNVLLNLYFAIFGGFKRADTRRIESQPIFDIVIDVLWSFFYFIRLACICAATDVLAREGNLTKIFISNIMRRHLDKNTKEELWNFLSYTVARKIKFTACGFFKIDFTLITAAIATGTTYLVILAQFHKGS